MLRSICKQSGESVESVLGMKRKATVGIRDTRERWEGFAERKVLSLYRKSAG